MLFQLRTAAQGHALSMNQHTVKLSKLSALLTAARSAACGLLPLAKVEANEEPKVQMAEIVRRNVFQAARAIWINPFEGGRFAFATSVAPSSEDSAFAKPFPHVLAYRKETPGLQAASPESTGQGATATENPRTLLSSKPIGWQSGQVQKPPLDAARIAMLRQYTLEEFDDLDSFAEEMGHEPLSGTAKANARKLVLRILDECPAYYYVCPEIKGSVSIGFAKRKKHYCNILCKANGSFTCFVALDGNTSLKRYPSIDGLPDDYMRQALAPPPYAESR